MQQSFYPCGDYSRFMCFFDNPHQTLKQIAGDYFCFHGKVINALIKIAHDDLFFVVIGIQQKLIYSGMQRVGNGNKQINTDPSLAIFDFANVAVCTIQLFRKFLLCHSEVLPHRFDASSESYPVHQHRLLLYYIFYKKEACYKSDCQSIIRLSNAYFRLKLLFIYYCSRKIDF